MLNRILNFIWVMLGAYGVIYSFRFLKIVESKKKIISTILCSVFTIIYCVVTIILTWLVTYATAADPDFNAWLWFFM